MKLAYSLLSVTLAEEMSSGDRCVGMRLLCEIAI
jgi:hypothetical protein